MTTVKWRNQEIPFPVELPIWIQKDIITRLEEMLTLLIVSEEAVLVWLKTPNEAFGDLTPIEDISQNGLMRINIMLASLRGDIYG